MSDQEEYEQGVRDGQEAGVGDQFCHSLSKGFTNPAYDKGFDYGLDHKPSDSNKSDSSNQPSSESSSKSDKSSEKPQEPESSTSSGSSYSGDGGYSSGGDWSGSSASIKPTSAIRTMLVMVSCICAILVFVCAIEYVIKGINSSYVTLLERGARIARTADKKAEIESFFVKKYASLPIVFIEVVPADENEIFVSISRPALFSGRNSEDILVKTLNGGNTWQTILSSNFIEHLYVDHKNGHTTVEIRDGDFWAISEDDGVSWRHQPLQAGVESPNHQKW
jgi:hypothetical protein